MQEEKTLPERKKGTGVIFGASVKTPGKSDEMTLSPKMTPVPFLVHVPFLVQEMVLPDSADSVEQVSYRMNRTHTLTTDKHGC